MSTIKNFLTRNFNLSRSAKQPKSVPMTLVFLATFLPVVHAQITNYKFEASNTTPYTEISGGTTLVAGGNVALGAATLKSAVTPIGFTFNYLGVDYTQFSVAATGHLQFGATQAAVFDNTNPLAMATPAVFAAWDWFTVGTAASGGGVTYQLSGAAPNRVLTVQWKVTKTANTATTHNFQVKLYEGSNKIEYVFGTGTATGLNFSTGLNGPSNKEHLYVFTGNQVLFMNMNIQNTTWPSTWTYAFTPKSTDNNQLVGLEPNFWVKADQAKLYERTFLNVPAANRTASSSFDLTNYGPDKSVFASTQAWLSSSGTYNVTGVTEFITLDLGSVQTIDGIGTMGRAANTQTTTSFTVRVSSDNVNWTNLGMFVRNENSNALHYSDFDAPVSCRYVRVSPADFTGSKALRLDVYTKTAATSYTDNTSISQWEDLSGNQNDAANFATSLTRPTFKTNQINFNPAMVFANAANSQLDMPDLGNVRASYWVAQYKGDGVDYDHVLYGNNSGTAVAPYFHSGVNGGFSWSGAMTDAQSAWWKDGTLGNIASKYDYGTNGKANLVTTNTKVVGTPYDAQTISFQPAQTRSWEGPIAEILTYQNTPTAAEQNAIETYLGVKYGITLGHDYVAADGTTVLWNKTTNTAYHNNVFGIGRNDAQGLHQRQSKSVNQMALITIGNNNIIGAENNASVGNNIATDNSYLVVGDNDAEISFNCKSSA